MWITQLFDYWSRQMFAPGTALRKKYQYFRDLLALDRFCLEKMAEIEEIHYRGIPCDYARVVRLCRELDHAAGNLAKSLIALNPLQILAGKYTPRATAYRIQAGLPDELIPMAVLALEMIDGRESGVPVVINVPEATALFESGQMVTIDGHRGQIHDGKAKPSELHLAGRKTWLSEKMKEILKPVARLNLTDAASEDFVEGGLTEKGDTLERVFLKHVACKPFLAMFAGLAHENIESDPDTIHFDWEEFDKMSAGIFNPTDSCIHRNVSETGSLFRPQRGDFRKICPNLLSCPGTGKGSGRIMYPGGSHMSL